MKRIITYLFLSIVVSMVSKAENELLKGIEWTSPERTGITEIDALYDRADSLYECLQTFGDSVVYYDVKVVANSDTGDTIVCVVDGNNNIRSPKLAFGQYSTATSYCMNLTEKILNVSVSVKDATPAIKNLVKGISSNPIESASILLTFGGNSRKILKMCRIAGRSVKDMLAKFKEQRKRIKSYKQWKENLSRENKDAKFIDNDIPDCPLDRDDVILMSNEEYVEGLENAEREDGLISIEEMDAYENID